MKSFNALDYKIDILSMNPDIYDGYKVSLMNDGRVVDYNFTKKYPKIGKLTSNSYACKTEEELLKEFEKMIDDANLGGDPIKLPLETPPPLPENIPKDGDHITLHKDHEVVKAGSNLEYSYCRDCKVEVVRGPKVTYTESSIEDDWLI